MSPTNETVDLIQVSFPGRDELVERTYRENRSFRELCHDYRECVAAVDRWKRPTAAEATLRFQEYSELLTELGREVETWLEGKSAGSQLSNRSSE